jgi:hypothetical protein
LRARVKNVLRAEVAVVDTAAVAAAVADMGVVAVVVAAAGGVTAGAIVAVSEAGVVAVVAAVAVTGAKRSASDPRCSGRK